MLRLLPILLLAGATASSAATAPPPSAATPPPTTSIPSVDAALQSFAAQKDSTASQDSYHFGLVLNLLRDAVDTVFNLADSPDPTQPDPLVLQSKTRALLRILQAARAAENPAFDPASPLPTVPEPPEVTHQTKAAYDAALALYSRQVNARDRETALRAFQASLQPAILAYVSATSSGHASVSAALTVLATAIGTDPAFTQKLAAAAAHPWSPPATSTPPPFISHYADAPALPAEAALTHLSADVPGLFLLTVSSDSRYNTISAFYIPTGDSTSRAAAVTQIQNRRYTALLGRHGPPPLQGLTLRLDVYPSPDAAAQGLHSSVMGTEVSSNRQETLDGLTLYFWDVSTYPLNDFTTTRLTTLVGNNVIDIYTSPSAYPFVFPALQSLLAHLPGASVK